ncbi:MAG: hypothetical protein HYW01_12430, partial [Deltaproteobacteria bacterium]|nr:hypothetical protein [Deltaproteobacteria bacterium]
MDVNSLMEVLKWPLVVIVIVLIFMIMFRQQIAGFINRIRGISPGGGIHTSDMPPQLSSEDGHLSAGELMDKLIRTLEADKLIRSLDSLVLREMEEIIKNELKASKLADSVEAIPILIRYLAVALLSCVFEYIYGQIWGSQLSILNHLNIRHDGETSDVIRSDFYIPASEL